MLISANLPIFKRFAITNQNGNKIVFVGDLRRIKEFYISFIHSVNRTPVEEHYRIADDGFVIYKTVFSSYGAGMPETAADSSFQLNNGEITVSNIDGALADFSLFVGTTASHTLYCGDGAIPLLELSPPQSSLKFEIKRVSSVQILSARKKVI